MASTVIIRSGAGRGRRRRKPTRETPAIVQGSPVLQAGAVHIVDTFAFGAKSPEEILGEKLHGTSLEDLKEIGDLLKGLRPGMTIRGLGGVEFPEEILDSLRPGSLTLGGDRGAELEQRLEQVLPGLKVGSLAIPGIEIPEEALEKLRKVWPITIRDAGLQKLEQVLSSLRPGSPTIGIEKPASKSSKTPPGTQEIIDAYLPYMEDGGAAEGYLKVRARKLRFFARQHPRLPDDPEVIRRYLRQFKTANVPTRQDQWKALAALYRFATKTYGIPNPMLDVDKPHFKKKPGKRLSRDQAKRFLSVVETDLEWSLVTCYFGLRLRRIEAERLLSEEIKSDYITVVGGKERGEELPLLPLFKDMLDKVENHGPNGRHFPIKADTMAYHIERIGRRAGFEVTPHMLRNTAAALWYYYGGDKSSNRMLLRHSTDDMTDHYSNEFLDELRAKDERHNPMLNLMRELGLAPSEYDRLKTRGDKLAYPNTGSVLVTDPAQLLPQLLDQLIALGQLAHELRHVLGGNGHRPEELKEIIQSTKPI